MHLEVKGLNNDTTTTQVQPCLGGTQPDSEDTADSGTTIHRKKPGACSVNLVGRRVWWGDRVEGKRRRGQRMSRRKERKLTVSEGF